MKLKRKAPVKEKAWSVVGERAFWTGLEYKEKTALKIEKTPAPKNSRIRKCTCGVRNASLLL
nr:hypothetical protein [uncultured Acetobacterium sp.]